VFEVAAAGTDRDSGTVCSPRKKPKEFFNFFAPRPTFANQNASLYLAMGQDVLSGSVELNRRLENNDP